MSIIFIFRRDLRLEDNLALNQAIDYAKTYSLKMVLAFAFNNEQVENNSYFSENAFLFMLQCLDELNKSATISFFDDPEFYEKISDVKAIAFNMDYTPYAIKRDDAIRKYCKRKNIECITAEDYTLYPVNFIKTEEKTPYKVFTPFYKQCIKHYKQVPTPHTVDVTTIKIVNKGTLKSLKKYYKRVQSSTYHGPGGRKRALQKLQHIEKGVYDDYKRKRDMPFVPNSTTEMSPFLKFGCISIREMFHVLKKRYGVKTELIKQLFWKEFYANITYHFPKVLTGMIHQKNNETFIEKYNHIKWSLHDNYYERWCEGKTGFPIVDAGMRQLNKTGFMHNRLRMITASFLIKDLHVDWRKGEQYFATKLIDYDPASNNGGWQWVAGTGTDASPYFRIFNPWTQTKRFDKDCLYIKQWVDELKDVPVRVILSWNEEYINHPNINYNIPIVKHDIMKKQVIHYYK